MRGRLRFLLRTAVVACAVLSAGCSTYFTVNRPLESWNSGHGYHSDRRWSPDRSEQLLLVLAFSGGGTRASAFSYGVLEELRDTEIVIDGTRRRLLDEVDHISAVSGGSFTAVYYGLYGDRIFTDYEEKFLRRNLEGDLLAALIAPWNWPRMASPYYDRGDLAAELYGKYVFADATFGDLMARGGPFIQINATDMATGHPFSFIQDQFDYLCSDLEDYPVARAVAASSAVPGVFTPITLENFSGACGFEPPDWIREAVREPDAFNRTYVNASNLHSYLDRDRRRFIRLVDGGLSDNLAVRGPFESQALQEPTMRSRPKAYGKLRSVVFILVNAATTPQAAWERADESLTLADVLQDATTVQINRYSLETMELLRKTFEAWDATATAWSPPAHFHLIEVDFTKVRSASERSFINTLPTSLRLDPSEVDRLRGTARDVLRNSPDFQMFLKGYRGDGGADR